MNGMIAEYWPWVVAGAWLVLAWGLSLSFRRSAEDGPRAPTFPVPGAGRIRAPRYIRLDYRVPPRSRRTIEETLPRSPEAKSIYLRAEFFLRFCSGFRPDRILRDALRDLDRLDRVRRDEMEATIAALRAGDYDAVYQPRQEALKYPLTLGFPLLPTEFTLFVSRRLSYAHKSGTGTLAPGLYRCEVTDWRDEDSYAETIELESMSGETTKIEQVSLIDAIRLEKATVESVSFLNLPIFIFASRQRKPRLRNEQRMSAAMAIRRPTLRDFRVLDGRLLRLFGGANPANYVRLSWFYHPEFGVKPDPAKYEHLVGESGGPRRSRA